MLHLSYGQVSGSYILQILARDFFLNNDPSSGFVGILQGPTLNLPPP